MRKLEHLIYTERRSGIGMNLEGKTPGTTGYGVYSMSAGLLPTGSFRDRVYLESAVNLKNGSRPLQNLLIHSFAYMVPAGGMPMLGYCYQRDAREDLSNRLASAYIAEWYFGELGCYPMDLFRSALWQAHQKPYTWYAAEAPNPTPMLNSVDLDSVKPVSLRSEALQFARDGREDIIRKAVWMLLKQMSLPLNERKYLVIRDDEENVRLWIAAILYQLPLQAAIKIGFNTNVTGLNNPQFNTYHFNKAAGSTVRMLGQASQDSGTMESRYHAMIVGIHPKDSTLPAGSAAQANRNYLVIDGVAKTCFPVEEGELNREYFRCMFTRDADITNFFMDMNEMVDVEPDLKLLDLFDAQRILQARDSWNHQSLTRSLGTMQPHFSLRGHAVLLNYVLKYLCCPEGYAARFASEDAEKQLTLMRLLRKSAAILNNTGAIAELDRAAYNYLKKLLADPQSYSKLDQYCRNLDAQDAGLSTRLLRDLLNSGLRFLDTVNLDGAPDAYIEQLFKLLNSHISSERSTWDRIWADERYHYALDRLALRVSKSESLTVSTMGLLRGNSQSTERLLLAGARREGSHRWLGKLISGSITLDYICSVMYKNNLDSKLIEDLLCGRMELGGPTPEIQDAYNRYLSLRPDAGQKYYATWFKHLSASKLNTPQYITKVNALLESAASRASDSKCLLSILQQLDASVTFEVTDYNRKVVDLLYSWYQRRRFDAKRAELWSFLDMILEVSIKNRSLSMYERYICRNPDCDKYPAPEMFVRTPMCKSFLDAALKDAENPAVHAVVLLLLNFTNGADQTEYLDEWAAMVCNATIKTKGKNKALGALYGLYDCYCVSKRPISRECDQIIYKSTIKECNLVLEAAVRSIGRYLCEVRTDKISDDIISSVRADYGNSAANGLAQLFETAQASFKNTHKSFFGGLGSKLSGLMGNKQDKE